MSRIFEENSDSDVELKTNNEYAKNYDVWRKKEELNKLKTKYGEDAVNFQNDGSSSSSSDDDEEGIEITEEVEKEFYKTLSCLKNKDPKIYDKDVVFFDDRPSALSLKKKKNEKEQPMYINDYERKIILEKNGILSDEENEYEAPISPTYVEEQQHIKKNLKEALENIEDNESDNWGGLFKVRQKTKEDQEKEELDYKAWLGGQTEEVKDENMKTELKPLKDFWSNPNLDAGEKFLRDYILNKKFLDKEDENYIPTYDEIIHDSDESLTNDEDVVEKQEEFEHKYNFRFEEPDQDFIKRYPRTTENSLRKTDDKRKVKRAELKERKKKEKEEKMADLKQLQELKRKEIEEKIEKLKEITGNTDIAFKDDDLDGDFDPEAHDRRMQALFDDKFYEGPEDEQKPEFRDIDEELELENWEKWNGPEENEQDDETTDNYDGPHCEDDNFNMDADFDPKKSTHELIENSKGRKKRKRKSKFAEALGKPKPKYDPNDKNFEKYFEEYYKLDCEDIIGDVPCRFKYREVAPNDFGLTVEEILLAKDRELNKWCSLKKAVQYRPDHVEKYEQIAYSKKARNIDLKKKILPSLFNPEPEVPDQEPSTSKIKNTNENMHKDVEESKEKDTSSSSKSNKNLKKKSEPTNREENKNTSKAKTKNIDENAEESNEKDTSSSSRSNKKLKKKSEQTNRVENENTSVAKTNEEIAEIEHERTESKNGPSVKITDKNTTTKKKKKKNKKKQIKDNNKNNENKETKVEIRKKRRKNNTLSHEGTTEVSDGIKKLNSTTKNIKKKNKKQKPSEQNEKSEISQNNINRKRKLSDSNNDSKAGVSSKKKFKKNSKNNSKDNIKVGISDSRLAAYGINPKKFKNKLKYGKS